MTLCGYDISHHNWTQIKIMGGAAWLSKAAREGFVFIKATEGQSMKDNRCLDYVSMAGQLPFVTCMDPADAPKIGLYHYARPEYNLPQAEADNFLSMWRAVPGEGVVIALDVEGRALQVPNVGKWALDWCRAVERVTKVKPLIYCQQSAVKLFKECAAADYGLWLASWQDRKPGKSKLGPWPFMAIWQYSSLGIDKDYFFGDSRQWFNYAGVNFDETLQQ